jgi:hypothetical protein
MSNNDPSFTIDLPVKGQAEVDAAARSVDVLAARLDKTSKAFERVGIAAEAQRDKLRLASELGNVKGQEQAAARLRLLIDRQAEYSKKVEESKAALNAAAAAHDKLSKSTAKSELGFEGIRRGLNKLGGPLAEIGGRVAEVGAGFQKLSEKLGAAGPWVASVVFIAAVTAAFLALAAGVVVATLKILDWSVALADVNRTNNLLAQGMLRTAAGSEALTKEIDSLTGTLPLTREEIAGTAQQLAYAGLRGKALNDWLQRSAEWAARIKFGPNFRQEMLALPEQAKVLQLNLRQTFGGLKVESLLEALQKMGTLLSDSTESGKAIKGVFESLFQPIVDGLTEAEPKIERFFLQLEIWALKALIAIKPHASLILKIGEAFVIAGVILTGSALIAGIIALTAVLIPFAVAAWAATLPVLAVVVAVVALGAAVYQFSKLLKELEGFDLGKALFATGTALIKGLVDGIKAAGSAVWDALSGIVGGAVDKVKALLGIHSPSLVFQAIGENTGAGMAIGVDSSAGRVQSSLESMVSPPDQAAGGSTSKSSSSSNSISGNTFIFNGVAGAEDAESRFSELLTRFVEGDAAQLGAAGTQGVSA